MKELKSINSKNYSRKGKTKRKIKWNRVLIFILIVYLLIVRN